MIEQSLCHHLQSQLTEYYQLIAVLESQASSVTEQDETTTEQYQNNLTLRRLDVWINEWRLRLRMMSVCVEGARGKNRVDVVVRMS
jgi:gamma-tubulin complex component 3